jgi:tellurite resistance protein
MGLFSSMRSAVTGKPSAAEAHAKAILTTTLLTAAADGSIEQGEIIQITNLCAFSPIFHAIGVDRTKALIDDILKNLRKNGAEACFTEAKQAMTPGLAETAICFACRVALADGQVTREEKETLFALGSRLDVPPETFIKIFDVMLMLQRPAA